MHYSRFLCLLTGLLWLVLPSLAAAQSYAASNSYIAADVARLEEEVRRLRGQNERLQHQIQQLKEAQRRFQEDIEFRLSGNMPGGMPGGMPVPPPPGNGSSAMPPASSPPVPPGMNGGGPSASTPFGMHGATQEERVSVSSNRPVPTTEEDEPVTTGTPQSLGQPIQASSPRELYNQAFRMLNQTNYDGAERTFSQFINEYKDDPLIGNAWYWLGETFYVRREYVRAADAFRQGFESMEEGPKAGDNLLKLAMSLAAMEKDQEACVVLKQVEGKYAENSDTLKNKTRQEISRLGC